MKIKNRLKAITILVFIFFGSFFETTFAGEKSEENKSLRIITYNIWCGFDHADSSKGKDREREEKCINFIRSLSPDVVALEELNDFTQEKLIQTAKKWGHDYAVILKENGYPVGITSNKPIETLAKIEDPLWHGLLHVKTHDIDFFVLHLSPSDDEGWRHKEADLITTYMHKSLGTQKRYVVLGDFNAFSPFDASFYKELNPELNVYEKNCPNNQPPAVRFNDFRAMCYFLSFPTIDVCERYVTPRNRYSYPTSFDPENIGKKPDTTTCRIDYILVSPFLAGRCTGADIIHTQETVTLSDHFPVIADFMMTE